MSAALAALAVAGIALLIAQNARTARQLHHLADDIGHLHDLVERGAHDPIALHAARTVGVLDSAARLARYAEVRAAGHGRGDDKAITLRALAADLTKHAHDHQEDR